MRMMIPENYWGLIYLTIGVVLLAYKWYKKETDIARIVSNMRAATVYDPIAAILILMVIALLVILWPYVLVNTIRAHRNKKDGTDTR